VLGFENKCETSLSRGNENIVEAIKPRLLSLI
jgi:hypothetical protein